VPRALSRGWLILTAPEQASSHPHATPGRTGVDAGNQPPQFFLIAAMIAAAMAGRLASPTPGNSTACGTPMAVPATREARDQSPRRGMAGDPARYRSCASSEAIPPSHGSPVTPRRASPRVSRLRSATAPECSAVGPRRAVRGDPAMPASRKRVHAARPRDPVIRCFRPGRELQRPIPHPPPRRAGAPDHAGPMSSGDAPPYSSTPNPGNELTPTS